MRKLLLSALILLAPVAAFAHGGEDHGEGPKQAASAAPAGVILLPKESQFLLGVRTEPVSRRKLEMRTTVPGKVIPRTDRHAQIFAPVAGRVLSQGSQIPLVGTRVKKGQVLAVLQQSLSASEASGLATGRIQAEAAVGQAQAALEQARRDLDRVKSLAGVVAQKEVQQAEFAVQVAEQEHTRAVRERELYAGAGQGGTGGKLSQFPLVSPLDGVLVEANATLGEQVEPSKVLFTVLDPQVVWVEANVFPDDIPRIEEAREALVKVEGYADRWFPAKLFNLGQVVEESTRTVKVIFEVQNDDGRLRPGTFAEVAIGSGGEQESLAVPDAAVVEVEGRKRVYVHVGPEEFVARDVALGARDGEYHVVRQGLKEGERVVTRGTYQLRSAAGGQ
ncbi:efflux RND transporter periplasmic adaptor subunit [Hyalangium rubrum]|uniref:Efflux RND transporter periplasmic adaptor subunit n=1 Tax=Hyalangium rubrum TaxID=3103134 RepID=A0ABU5H8P3_9BACT|nr:efflux RND transporter periplasmic adaptor subunit [Hyalangium sp. s54d21]MDY7229853.1 efflux RND transporter periplasmic adaptor subunit [Hyalangium sp. s54d21]